MTIRFLERHLLNTVTAYMKTTLTAQGWITGTINFGAAPLTITNLQPDTVEDVIVVPQTLAISLGDSTTETLEQLGGGLYCLPCPVFFDVYGQDSSTAVALACDIRDALKREKGIVYSEWYTGTAVPVPGALITFESVVGPEYPVASQLASNIDFRKHWRVVKAIASVDYLD